MAIRTRLKGLALVAEPRAGAILGAAAGLLAGWFGLAAGIVIGTMVDAARLEARERKRIEAFLKRPEAEAAPRGEAMAGFAAAACLALRGEWPGGADAESRRVLWDRLAFEALPPTAKARREAERITDASSRAAGADLPGLSRFLATNEAPRARRLLADWAFALAALGLPGGEALDPGSELALRALLGDAGLGAEEIGASRARAFPGERDPWTVLGLAPGASRTELKRAYRRLSRAFHPDAAPGDDGSRFREVRDAYARLSR